MCFADMPPDHDDWLCTVLRVMHEGMMQLNAGWEPQCKWLQSNKASYNVLECNFAKRLHSLQTSKAQIQTVCTGMSCWFDPYAMIDHGIANWDINPMQWLIMALQIGTLRAWQWVWKCFAESNNGGLCTPQACIPHKVECSNKGLVGVKGARYALCVGIVNTAHVHDKKRISLLNSGQHEQGQNHGQKYLFQKHVHLFLGNGQQAWRKRSQAHQQTWSSCASPWNQ